MEPGSIRSWQEFFIAGTVAVTLQLAFAPPAAEAAVDSVSNGSPIASINTLPVAPGTAAASSTCEGCNTPAALREKVTDLVITTTMPDGGYVAVWQNKYDNLIYGQCFSRGDRARGGTFHIGAELSDGMLPIILVRKDGGFFAAWQQDGKRYEQHFSPRGMPLGNAACIE